jgi:toxin FitB
MAARNKKGRPGDLRDTMIAGIALAQHAALATRNPAHFEDASIPLVDPWSA